MRPRGQRRDEREKSLFEKLMQEITDPADHHLLVEDQEIGITTDVDTYPISHGLNTAAASNPKAIASNKKQTYEFLLLLVYR